MSKNVADNNHKELEGIISKGLDELKGIMTVGSKKLNLPVLAPYKIDAELFKSFSFTKGNFDLSIKQPVINGLDTLEITSYPTVSIQDGTISFTIGFKQLKLESDDFAITGTYKLLFRRRNLNKSGGLVLDINGVNLSVNLKLELQQGVPVVIDNDSQCIIDDIDLDLEDSFVLDLIVPFFKSKFEELISKCLQNTLSTLLSQNIQKICVQQHETIDKLKVLYELKKAQGFDRDGDGTPDKPRVLEGFGGVGQLPVPLFWELPAVDVKNTPHISIDDLLKVTKTGDVILFAGSYPSSQKIRRMTQSCFSHVIIVIKEPDIAEGQACIWQATSSTHKGVLRNMLPKSGIQLNYLEDMIHDYRAEDAEAVVCWRALSRSPRPEAEESQYWQQLKAFIMEMDGNPYTDDMNGLYTMGLMEIDNPKKDDYFCAGLVAESLMRFGILNNNFCQYQYAPRDFSERQPTLPFLNPKTHFEDEIVID